MIVLLELLTVLLEYIDLSVIAAKDSYYYTNILPIMLALCSMLSGTYYAHNYASIIGGSLTLILVTVLALSGYSHEAIPQLYSQLVDMCYHLLSPNADIKIKGICKNFVRVK